MDRVDIGLKLIDRFDTDYLQNKYHKKQLKVCKELNIQPSKCVIFGITDKNHKEFGNFDREQIGNEYAFLI